MAQQDPPIPELDVDHYRDLLEAQRAELTADDALSQETADTVELDQTRQGRLSRMDAMQQQAMAAETHRRRGFELQRIAAALKRIEKGEYGFCLSCAEPIALGRLEIDPASTRCIQCAEKGP